MAETVNADGELHEVYLDHGGTRLTCRSCETNPDGDYSLVQQPWMRGKAAWQRAVAAFRTRHPFKEFKFYPRDTPCTLAK